VEIDERLREIEVTQAETLVVLKGLDEKIDTLDARAKKVQSILVGDGNGIKGHNVRLDRLEQAAAGVRRLFYGLMVPVALLLVKAVAGLLGTPEV
jgi:hypothetical protein